MAPKGRKDSDTADETTEGPGGGQPREQPEQPDDGDADGATPRSRARRGAHTSGDDDEREKPDKGTRYLNTTGGPLVYDHDGHTVAAGEWTPETNLDAIGKALRTQNHLLPPSAL